MIEIALGLSRTNETRLFFCNGCVSGYYDPSKGGLLQEMLLLGDAF